MKKLLISISLLLVLVLAIVACKNTGNEETTTDGTNEAVSESQSETPSESKTEAPTSKTEETTSKEETTTEKEETTTTKKDEVTTEKEEEPTEPPDPMAPTVVADAEQLSGMNGTHGIESIVVTENYVTITPEDGDPYGYVWTPGSIQPGARFVSIKYRTSTATNATMQIYLSSKGTGPSDDTSMLQQSLIVDGEWHLLIFDTQSLIDAGIYDGEKISYLRFDPLEAGYKLDENGEKYYEDEANKTWARYELPEGCSIDIEYVAFFQSEKAADLYEYGPTLIVTPDQIKEQADNTGGATFNQSVESAVIKDNYITLEAKGGDPYVAVIPIGANLTGDKVIAVKYRTTFAGAAQFFIGSGSGWGAGDATDSVPYINDGEWHLITIDLSGRETYTDNKIGFCRYDFFSDAADENKKLDIQYIAFFPSAEDAQKYDEIISAIPDTSNTFESDVDSQTEKTDFKDSDLKNGFEMGLPTDGHIVNKNSDGKLEYQFSSINEIYTSSDGKYALVLDINSMSGDAYAFVRGSRVIHSKDMTENLPAGAYMINNFYETDGAGKCGGSGIYAQIVDGKVNIVIKSFDGEALTRVKNKVYTVDMSGSKLTIADDGKNVYIMADDKIAAVITLTGEVEYNDDLAKVEPAVKFAAKAVITLADGTTDTIGNTLVASTCSAQLGLVVRSGALNFSSVKVLPYSKVTIPDTVLGSMTLDKETYAVGETIKVTAKSANTSGKDWVGIYAENDVPGSGDVQSIAYIYIKDASEIVLSAEKFTAGTYKVYFFENDTFDNLIDGPITITVTGAADTPDPAA